jgi:hypothetical protein
LKKQVNWRFDWILIALAMSETHLSLIRERPAAKATSIENHHSGA